MEPIRAWLIEDEASEAELITAHLPEVEIGVRLGAMLDAVDHLTTHRPHPDVLVVDLDLPDSRGLATLNRLLDVAYGLPVIAVTADVRAARKAVQLGAHNSLPKANLIDLDRVVRTAVERSGRGQRGRPRARPRFAAATSDLLVVMDEDHQPVHLNPAFTAALGWRLDDVAEWGWRGMVHSDDRDRTTRALRQLSRDERIVTVEQRFRAADGDFRLLRWRLARDSSSRLVYGIARDIGAVPADPEQPGDRSRRDELTGLPSRLALLEHLAESIRTDRQFAVLCCDLDGFRRVNEELGHAAGDEVLQLVGSRLRPLMRRRADLVARYDGDTFVLVADRTTAGSTAWLVERALATVAQPITVEDEDVTVGMSIGIVDRSPLLPAARALLTAAAEALYVAKRAGRNQAHRFGPELGTGLY